MNIDGVEVDPETLDVVDTPMTADKQIEMQIEVMEKTIAALDHNKERIQAQLDEINEELYLFENQLASLEKRTETEPNTMDLINARDSVKIRVEQLTSQKEDVVLSLVELEKRIKKIEAEIKQLKG